MNLVVGSAFRNASGLQISRYMLQVLSLCGHGFDVRVIASEGDSVDGTRDQLVREAHALNIPLTLVDSSHGGPVFGSTEDSARMRALSKVGNSIFEAVLPSDDVLVYVESDLIWHANDLLPLILSVQAPDLVVDIVAPFIFAGDLFYDIWAFRKNGDRFSPFPPYHIAFEHAQVAEMDSVGSCLVMRGEAARSCRMLNGGALVDWCADARSKGFRIWADSRYSVRHPA